MSKRNNHVLKKILHEPLLHFLLLGGLLFVFYAFSASEEENENSIVISKSKIEQLTSEWEKESLSIMSAEEKQELIDEEIYVSILYKEALKTGLDINDADLKSHLADKMAFLLYDTYELPTPSDEVLEKFMLENPNNYREQSKISFTQSMRGEGETTFEKQYTLNEFEVNDIFGRSFSEVLFKLEVNKKVQMLESDYGVHEVVITNKPIGELKTFFMVKEELQNDYLNLQREEKNKIIYEALKSQYNISIEEK